MSLSITATFNRRAEVAANNPQLSAPIGIDVTSLRVTAPQGRRRETILVHDATFSIEPGELVAIVGGSGSGKTTLLNAMAGLHRVAPGMVRFNGDDLAAELHRYKTLLGYVPQDDIVHKDLTVERTLHFAARLRIPDLPEAQRGELITQVLDRLELTSHRTQRVASLSGGQRKRTSIGAELLTDPGLFFLDEPTSGLDPSTGRAMMRLLQQLALRGSTVVLTTHTPSDIIGCDRVIFLARGGHVAYAGPPAGALEYFRVASFEDVYEKLANDASPAEWAERYRAQASGAPRAARISIASCGPRARRGTGALGQAIVLTQRNFEILSRNALTLAILAGSPALVITMFAILFRPGAFEADASPTAAIMTVYWIAFAGFFFGLTYGLLQICTEMSIYRRERLVNLRVVPYVLSKVAVLLPLMVIVVLLMVGVLRALDRLPSADFGGTYAPLTVTLLLDGLAGIALGLFASASVSRPEQATLVLPMVCFPQVLFSGAILPVSVMAQLGRVISYAMSDRWAFEAIGKSLTLDRLLAGGSAPRGSALVTEYQSTFSGGVYFDWLVMAAMTVLCLAATCAVLSRGRTTFR